MKYGYARASSADQDVSIQEAALRAAGCDTVRTEKASGTKRAGRTELQVLIDFVRAGDEILVTRFDRLARDLRDLQDIAHELQAKGVSIHATEQQIDTSTAHGRAFFQMLGVFAEFETRIRRDRQLEGIAAAKAADKKEADPAKRKYRGRKPSLDVAEVRRLRGEGVSAIEVAKRLKVSRASVYRVLDEKAAA